MRALRRPGTIAKTVWLAVLMLSAWAGAAAADRLTVFAAASLKTALDDIATGFEAQTGHSVRLSYAGSSILARQIQFGAPADIFISANSDWMDQLENLGLIVPETRVDIVSNTLVLIAPESATPQSTAAEQDLSDALVNGRVAMALVDAVPAGIYGKAALKHLGLWDVVAPRVVQADNVRAALTFVASGETPWGIVYGSDARAENRVTVIAAFPRESHPEILYPGAVLRDRDTMAARNFLDHLQRPEVQAAFARHGFAVLGG